MAATDTITVYDIGDVATVTVAFVNAAGAATDPTAVTARAWKPDGTTTDYTVTAGQIVKDSVGNYHLDIPANMAGDWHGKFVGTGTVVKADPWAFTVRDDLTAAGPLDPTALTTLHAVREYVLRNPTDGSQDFQFRRLINSYSKAIYRYTRREWLPATAGAARKFAYSGAGFLSLAPYEARTVTAVTLFTDMPTANQRTLNVGSSTVESEFRLGPRGKTTEGTYLWIDIATRLLGLGAFSYLPNVYAPFWTVIGRDAGYEVTVTGDWGVGSVPTDVELALLVAIKDAYENPTGYAAGTEGGLQFVEQVESDTGPDARARNLPVESRALLIPYKRSNPNQTLVA